MLNWFKKHFIPHEGNNHRPHFLHKESIRNILILVIFVEVFAFLGPTISEINKTGGDGYGSACYTRRPYK